MLSACAAPDPREVRGALAAAAVAVEQDDGRALFRLIDQRARHAMASIRTDRAEAAKLIEADYPEAERARALAALGEAAQASDPADLFVRRCAHECRQALGRGLGAPLEETAVGDELQVRTAADATVRVFRGRDGRYGLVWHTEELSRERDQAARELTQIRDNAAIYRKRRALEAAAGKATTPGTSSTEASAPK